MGTQGRQPKSQHKGELAAPERRPVDQPRKRRAQKPNQESRHPDRHDPRMHDPRVDRKQPVVQQRPQHHPAEGRQRRQRKEETEGLFPQGAGQERGCFHA